MKLAKVFVVFLCFAIQLLCAEEAPVDFSGVWMPTAIGPDGKRNKIYPDDVPYRPEVKAGLADFEANYNPLVDDASRSCLPYGMPRQMLMLAQYPTEFIQTKDRLMVIVELHNDVRRIYLDGRNTPQGLLPRWMGFSAAHWNGKTLVVNTTHMREKGYPRPQSFQLEVEERYRFVDGGNTGRMIELVMTFNDPKIYTEPFTVKTYYRQYDDLEMGEYFCSEDLWRQNLDGKTGEYIPWR